MNESEELFSCQLHQWFELSYAQYLTIPRSVMQEMPYDWRFKMAALLEELDETLEWRPSNGRYWVQLRDSNGRYNRDPLSNYKYPIDIKRKASA